MNRILMLFAVAVAVASCCCLPASAEESEPGDSPESADTSSKRRPAVEAAVIPTAASKPVLSTNTVRIGGREIDYVAETGMLPLLSNEGKVRASVFYTAYTLAGMEDPATRPVMFCFNGGPGSSSVWLHLGGLGPRRVMLNPDGTLPPPPFRLGDNAHSILHVTDLVFIDPVATGYSRPGDGEKAEQFFGQSPDIESVGDFIRLWTTRNERWRSPKYLCGESYGVFRAAGMALHLQSRHGLYLNGLVLLSGVLDFVTLRPAPGNDLPYLTFLPTLTATAHFHGKLPDDLQQDLALALREAREFALGDYAIALLQGAALSDKDHQQVATRLARLTGLPQSLIEDHNLRISATTFREYLLRDEGLILGRFDARITGRDADRSSTRPLFDPSYTSAYGPFSAAMNAYVREELRFTNDLPYEIIAGVKPWNYEDRDTPPSVSGELASVLNQNPHLRVLVLSGLRDLATPPDGMRYTLNHLRIDPKRLAGIVWAEYEAGHMMYVNEPDLRKLQRDLETFLSKVSPAAGDR